MSIKTPEGIVMWPSEGWWVIKHEATQTTTQGKTRIQALLSLADALRVEYEGFEEDDVIIEEAKSTFQTDEEDLPPLDEYDRSST